MLTFNAGGHASDSWCLARDGEARARVLPRAAAPLHLCLDGVPAVIPVSAHLEPFLQGLSPRPGCLVLPCFPYPSDLHLEGVGPVWVPRVQSPHGARPSTCTTSLGPRTDPMG